MPEISGTRSIKCTTWIKTQIGCIELTSALPYINAQNIQKKSVEYVYKLNPKINCREVKIIIHSDWQNPRSDKKCTKLIAKISLINSRINLLGGGMSKCLKISSVEGRYKYKKRQRLDVCAFLLTKFLLALFIKYSIISWSINWLRHRRTKGQPPLGWPRF